MPTDINLENCLADLENLAHEIYKYLELRDRLDADDPKLAASLDSVFRQLKNCAVIHTNVIGEAMAAKPVLPPIAPIAA